MIKQVANNDHKRAFPPSQQQQMTSEAMLLASIEDDSHLSKRQRIDAEPSDQGISWIEEGEITVEQDDRKQQAIHTSSTAVVRRSSSLVAEEGETSTERSTSSSWIFLRREPSTASSSSSTTGSNASVSSLQTERSSMTVEDRNPRATSGGTSAVVLMESTTNNAAAHVESSVPQHGQQPATARIDNNRPVRPASSIHELEDLIDQVESWSLIHTRKLQPSSSSTRQRQQVKQANRNVLRTLRRRESGPSS